MYTYIKTSSCTSYIECCQLYHNDDEKNEIVHEYKATFHLNRNFSGIDQLILKCIWTFTKDFSRDDKHNISHPTQSSIVTLLSRRVCVTSLWTCVDFFEYGKSDMRWLLRLVIKHIAFHCFLRTRAFRFYCHTVM